jgi:hypothetical protein
MSSKKPDQLVYKYFNRVGWDKVSIVLVEEFACENKGQLRQKEDEYIQKHRHNPLCLNTNNAVMVEHGHLAVLDVETRRAKRKSSLKIKAEGIIRMPISSSSADTYSVILSNIRRGVGGDTGFDFLLDFAKVKTWLETNPTKKTKKPLSHNSLKTYYSAIKSVMKDDPKFASVVSDYDTELKKFVEEMRVKDDDQLLTEDEKRKWVCWSCIEETRDRLLTEWEDEPSWELYQDYLILCLYTFQEPTRLDYAPMRFVKEAPKDSIENFCVLNGETATFILNSYKTAHKYGTLSWDAPPSLVKVLTTWREMNKTEWLLVKGKDKRAMNTQELGLSIKDIFVRLTTIGATLNIIRHAYRTDLHEGEPSLTAQKETARRMGHSVVMGQRYRRIDAEQKSQDNV